MPYHLKHKPEKWILNARVLGVDHSARRIGLAVSHADQTLVTPLKTLHRTKWTADRTALNTLIQDYEVKAIVVGYPLNMDGSAGARCQSVKDFVTLMEQAWPDITFFFWDERLSTAALDDSVHKSVHKDSFAAKAILDDALGWIKRRHCGGGDTS